MKISIDTKEDTHEDIKKVIRMLQHLVGESPFSNSNDSFDKRDIFNNNSETNSSEGVSAFGAMFGSDNNNVGNNILGSSEKPKRFEEKIELVPY